jgi:hypothetical protein
MDLQLWHNQTTVFIVEEFCFTLPLESTTAVLMLPFFHYWDIMNSLLKVRQLIEIFICWFSDIYRMQPSPWPNFFYLSDDCRFLDMGHPLWWEDGSVIYLYNCFWALPEQSPLGRSPAELRAIFYCLIWDSPNLYDQVRVFFKVKVMSWCRTPSGSHDHMFITVDNYCCVFVGTLSDERSGPRISFVCTVAVWPWGWPAGNITVVYMRCNGNASQYNCEECKLDAHDW